MAQYLKNLDLLNEIILSKKEEKLTTKAVGYIMLMADKIGLEFRYRDPEDLEDCRSEAILNVLNYWSDFDENKSRNAFAYFTEVIKTGFGIGWNKLYKKQIRTISLSGLENINNI